MDSVHDKSYVEGCFDEDYWEKERESRTFNVKVGMHQGSVLSPMLFIIVLEALSREFRESGNLWICFMQMILF